MNRYLLNISYIGTYFRGLQKLTKLNDVVTPDLLTVQGQLEIALRNLKNVVNAPRIESSSRTDSGVHALHSTVHVDLEQKNGQLYKTSAVTAYLNRKFGLNKTPIRVLKTYNVPSNFHCRHAVSRTYLYRLAVSKKSDYVNSLNHIPIEELDRCHFISNKNVDMKKFSEAAQLFLGMHDFRTFMGRSNDPVRMNKVTRRVIEKFDVIRMRTPEYTAFSWPECVSQNYDDYIHYHIVIKSSGFVYKQIRRTIGALIAAGTGRISIADVQWMLKVPSLDSWHPAVKSAPPYGLYLSEVAYDAHTRSTFREVL